MRPVQVAETADNRPWRIVAMNEADAEAIAGWQYPAPYDFYNMTSDPEDLSQVLDPKRWGVSYFAVHDDRGSLVGFFEFLQEGSAVVVGLGMRPDLTGRGLGAAFVQSGLDFAQDRWSPLRFCLCVATFNQRAMSVYGKVGFTPGRTFLRTVCGRQVEFLEMDRA
jgi:[ribosomal protein S18]-alanine N-acetyltransferase